MYDVFIKVESVRDRLDEMAGYFDKDLCGESLRQVTVDPGQLPTSFVKIEQAPEPLDREIEVTKLYVDHEIKQEMAIGPTVVQSSGPDLQQQQFTYEITASEEHVDYKTCDKKVTGNRKIEINGSLVNTVAKLHACSKCDKVLERRYDFKMHLHTHTGEKPFKCDACGKEFMQSSTLKTHFMYLHTDSRPYVCDVCNKGFISKSRLNLHSRIHTKEKPYQCNECGKRFNRYYHYKEHVVFIHTDIRPYTCRVCKKDFPSNHSLKRHIQIHTGNKPYKCDICTKSFADRSTLRKHLLHIHSNKKNTYL